MFLIFTYHVMKSICIYTCCVNNDLSFKCSFISYYFVVVIFLDDAQVIMAAGAFVSGSSIELSADGPMKDPYAVYFQGGLTWEHAKYGIMMSLQKIYETGKLKNILINDTES